MNNLKQMRKDSENRKEELLCLLRDALRLCVTCFLFSPIFSHVPGTFSFESKDSGALIRAWESAYLNGLISGLI
jgi:hypothetical protein